MQNITVTKDVLANANTALATLQDIAAHVGLKPEEVAKLQDAKGKDAPWKDLPHGKLAQKLHSVLSVHKGFDVTYKQGQLQLDIASLPDVTAEQIGANKQGSGTRATSATLTGPYHVARTNGLKCTEATDAGKWSIWQHVWACNTFEQYFQKAPKEAKTRTGRKITASSEIRWALKSGWITAGNPVVEAAVQQDPTTAPGATPTDTAQQQAAATDAQQQDAAKQEPAKQ